MTGFERTRPVQVCWLASGFRVFGKQNGRLVGSWEVDFSFSVAPITIQSMGGGTLADQMWFANLIRTSSLAENSHFSKMDSTKSVLASL